MDMFLSRRSLIAATLALLFVPFFTAAIALCGPGDSCVPNGNPPVFSGPGDITLYTNDPEGSVYKTYTITASGDEGPIDPFCVTEPTPTVPDTYELAIGDYAVTCTANDGDLATYPFFISVILDTDVPTITAPLDQSFTVSSLPATPTLIQATASDTDSGIASITYNPMSFNEAGTFPVTWTATDNAGNTATAQSNVTIIQSSPETETVAIGLRDGTTLIGPISVSLPSSGFVEAFATGSSTPHSIPARSALALLLAVDTTQPEFEITDLAYNYDYGSFIINCITIPSVVETPRCFNWLYAIDGNFPALGADATTLSASQTGIFYFNSPSWDIALSDNTVETNEQFTVTAKKYNPATNTYDNAAGVVVGATQPGGPPFFMATEFATSTTNASGQTTLAVSTAGTYQVGVQESFYYPFQTLIVANPSTPPTGGGSGNPPAKTFNVPAALAFLALNQGSDGSISNPLFSDWIALAFAAQDPGDAKTKLRNYLLSNPSAGTAAEDYERRAMALMALGINPYSGTATDYIAPIVALFDGTQIGQSYVQDDIFAVFPLLKAGYSTGDNIIQKIVAYIVASQSASGAWSDPDTTSAAVQALSLAQSEPGVANALTKAKNYLHSQQQPNGGFSNVSSTGWVMQAIAAFSEPLTNWTVGSKTPLDHLALSQQTDGGVTDVSTPTNDLRIWATAYAIPGALNKTWDSLLSSFAKPTSGGNPTQTSATTTATTTVTVNPVATSTPPTATSTPPLTIDVPEQGQVLGAATVAEITETTPTTQREIATTEVVPDSEDETATTTIETGNVQVASAGEAVPWNINWWLVLAILFLLLLLGLGYQFWYARTR